MNKSNIQLDILLDMDEVINNLTHHWVKTLNFIHRLSVDFEKISEWDMKKAYPTLTPEHIYLPLYIEDFWNGVKLLPGAKEGINELLSMGHRVFILTSSYPQNVAIKAKWLSKNLPEIPWKNIIIAEDKSMIKGDVIIDDGLHNFYGEQKYKFLLDKPWNRECYINKKIPIDVFMNTYRVTRLYDWNGILKAIKELNGRGVYDTKSY